MVGPKEKGEGCRISDQTTDPGGQFRTAQNNAQYGAQNQMKAQKGGKGDKDTPSRSQSDGMGVLR